jgi:DNA-binding IclR family transcriptional regulator
MAITAWRILEKKTAVLNYRKHGAMYYTGRGNTIEFARMRSIKSAERVLSVFELFSKLQTPLTVGQVASELEIPQPSVSMLLYNLVELGYLEHDAHRRTFAPSIRIVLLGSWIQRRFSETALVSKRLDDLYRQVKETSYIAMQNGCFVQYIQAQVADRPNPLYVQSGQFRSLTNTAAGRALLAAKSNAEIASWVKRCNAEVLTPPVQPGELDDLLFDMGVQFRRTPVRIAEFMSIMERARRRGYAETAGEELPGQGAYAVTFPFPMGNMLLAVGAGGPIDRVQKKREQIVDALNKFREGLLAGA